MQWLLCVCVLLLQSFCGLKTVTVVHGSNRRRPPCEQTDNQSQLNSFLWMVKRDPPSYFFGTIHVPYTRVWDFIPENTKQAFDQAQSVFFELDLTDPYTISDLANCQLLPHGDDLSNVLPEDLYLRLKGHLEYVKEMMPYWMTEDQRGRGLYADYLFNAITGNWERKRPVWVMLMVNSLTESDIKSRGIPVLDLYLAQEADRMSKHTGAVESVQEQCIPLNELNFSQVLFALNQTLWQHDNYRRGLGSIPYTTDDLIRHYNCGDLNTVIFNHDTAQVPNLVNASLPPRDLLTAKRIDQYFRQELIYKRNERMADRVVRLLKQHPNKSFFFAFGAGHFLGNNTVIDKLQEQGFEMQHIAPEDSIPVIPRSRHRQRKRKKKKDHLALSDFPMPPIVVSGHRNRHNRKKKKNKQSRQPKLPRFNDLWVRIDPSGDPESRHPDVTTRSTGALVQSPNTGTLKSAPTLLIEMSVFFSIYLSSFLPCR